ncbi:DNA-directed RNA polymerase II subunit RPB9 [Manis javanica]|nr:DNA-directed RNA polymerase II subunit RPB9 [Manis javanica]
MLYPRGQGEPHSMLCLQDCGCQQEADNSWKYVNKIMHEVDELTQIIANIFQGSMFSKTEHDLAKSEATGRQCSSSCTISAGPSPGPTPNE